MANKIALIEKFSSQAWDKTYRRESISAQFDAKPGLFQFTGAKTVKIARWQGGGLSDYSRNNEYTGVGEVKGYEESSMQLVWNEYTIEKDRGTKIPIEKFDDEETDGLAIGSTTTELSRVVMIPEIDAYFFSKVYNEALLANNGNVVSGALSADTALAALNDGLTYQENYEVPAENQVICVSPNYMNLLRNSKEITKYLGQADYSKDVTFKMTTYEGRPFIQVPPSRFNTNVELHKNGYTLKGKPIDFMIIPKDSVTHIVKYQKVKVLDGDMALAASNQDGFVLYARVYHDVFVLQNKRLSIYAHTDGISGTETLGRDTISVKTKEGKVTSITTYPGDKYVMFGVSETQVQVGSVQDSITQIKVGDAITNNHYVYSFDTYKRVLAVVQVTY